MQPQAGTQQSTRQSFLARLPGPTRRTARQLFREALANKLTVEGILLDVSLRCQCQLFSPSQYRNLACAKRILDALRDDPEGAAAYAGETLRALQGTFTTSGGTR